MLNNNLLNPGAGLENFVIFLRDSVKNPPRIYSI